MGAATRAGYEFLVSLYNLRGRIHASYDWLAPPTPNLRVRMRARYDSRDL